MPVKLTNAGMARILKAASPPLEEDNGEHYLLFDAIRIEREGTGVTAYFQYNGHDICEFHAPEDSMLLSGFNGRFQVTISTP